MAPQGGSKKISLSVTNWLLGGSLVNVERKGAGTRHVSSKIAIRVDAEGNKVYADGTVKKKEKPPPPEPPKVEPVADSKKVEEKPKETGILKKSKTKGGDDEEEELIEKTCCGKCGKTIKAKGEGRKCQKHASNNGETKDNSVVAKPNEDSKDNGNKDDKSDQKQKKGKGDFTWTDELDKKLQDMFNKKKAWPEILSTLRTNRKNCDERLEYLEKQGTDKDDAATLKAKNDATEAALYANLPITDTNPGFGAAWNTDAITTIFGDDFAGDPQKPEVKSSWDTPVVAPTGGSWGPTGGEKQENKVSWDTPATNAEISKPVDGGWNAGSKPEAAWGSHDAATHTVEVPPAQPGWDGGAPVVPGGENNGESWGCSPAENSKTGESTGQGTEATTWGEQRPQTPKPDISQPVESKPSNGGWNDDNPHAKKSETTNTAAVSNGWERSDSTAPKDNVSSGGGWGTNSGGDNSGGGGTWGEGAATSNAWDVSGGQSTKDNAKSTSATTNWDTSQPHPAPDAQESFQNNNDNNKAQTRNANGDPSSNWGTDGATDEKPGLGSGGGNPQETQTWGGNGSNTWGTEGQGSTEQIGNSWGDNQLSKGQDASAPSGAGWNCDNPHTPKNSAPASNPANQQNSPGAADNSQNQSAWGANSGNKNPNGCISPSGFQFQPQSIDDNRCGQCRTGFGNNCPQGMREDNWGTSQRVPSQPSHPHTCNGNIPQGSSQAYNDIQANQTQSGPSPHWQNAGSPNGCPHCTSPTRLEIPSSGSDNHGACWRNGVITHNQIAPNGIPGCIWIADGSQKTFQKQPTSPQGTEIRQHESCSHAHGQHRNCSQSQPANTSCSHVQATPPHKLHSNGQPIWDTESNMQAQASHLSYVSSPWTPCGQHTTNHWAHQTSSAAPPPLESPQWIGTGMNNPHWQPRAQNQHTNNTIPQANYVVQDSGPKHVHFQPSTSGTGLPPTARHDIWSPHAFQPAHERNPACPAPSHLPIQSAFDRSNASGYAYNAPGAFPSSPRPSQVTRAVASKPETNNGW